MMTTTSTDARAMGRRGVIAALAASALTLGGCQAVLLHPAGDVAVQQRDLVIAAFALMMLIIVPVMALTVFFAFRYRHTNTDAVYDPDWHHSTALEVVIWSAPLAIIVCLGALTWVGTHTLDPYRPLTRLDATHTVAAGTRPLQVEVVAMDWKWLFIYPELGVATVNELAAPIGQPIAFRITATSVMNSFFVPALAGQIYAMPGMETQLHGVFNRVGVFDGFSANYSGQGFSDMRFKARAMSPQDFSAWVAAARNTSTALDRPVYLKLARPSEAEPAQRFGRVDADLYRRILNRCTEPGQTCMTDQMAADGGGGLSHPGMTMPTKTGAGSPHNPADVVPKPPPVNDSPTVAPTAPLHTNPHTKV